VGFEVTCDDGNLAGFQDDPLRLAIFKRQLMAEAIGNTDKLNDANCQDKIALDFEVQDVDECHRHRQAIGVQLSRLPRTIQVGEAERRIYKILMGI
jgi:hypothetical protein